MTPWGAQIGSITPGKWADFVILDGTLPQPLDRSIRQRSVRSTYFAGKSVFEKK
jgi:predicted amidohydrolase YtcJ